MSRKLRNGTYQLGTLIADLREGVLKQYSQEVIPDGLIRKAYNDALMVYYDHSGIKDTDIYTDTVPVPIIKKVFSNASTGSSYTTGTQVLILPLVDAGNIEWTDSDGFDEDWVGTVLTITDVVSGLDYPATISGFIETIGNLTSVSIEESGIPTIAAANLVVQGETAADNEADVIDLTRYDNYKRIDKIIKMTSIINAGRSNSQSRPPCLGPPVIGSREFEGLRDSHTKQYSNYKDAILWIREGEKLNRSLGYSLSTYGDCTLTLTLLPAVMEVDSDYLDAPDTEKPNIDKIALVKVYSYMRKEDIITPLPSDLLQWYNELTQSKLAKKEEQLS